MITLSLRFVVLAVLGSFFLIGQPSTVEAKPCSKKSQSRLSRSTHLTEILPLVPVTADTRPGRCPHPQYAFSSLPCSVEGNDTLCPWDYKCCPLTNGMQCVAPCKAWSPPCRIACPFGLKVSPSPCTICECAEDPCLKRLCFRGAVCNVTEYEPCAFKGECGFSSRCVRNTSGDVTPVTKPKRCPDYWPGIVLGRNRLQLCNNSDGICPGEQKCCNGPPFSNGSPYYPNSPRSSKSTSYCADPCDSVANCTLDCPLGVQVIGGCRVCQCVEDQCLTKSCPPNQQCELRATSCASYPGSPPCPLTPVCV